MLEGINIIIYIGQRFWNEITLGFAQNPSTMCWIHAWKHWYILTQRFKNTFTNFPVIHSLDLSLGFLYYSSSLCYYKERPFFTDLRLSKGLNNIYIWTVVDKWEKALLKALSRQTSSRERECVITRHVQNPSSHISSNCVKDSPNHVGELCTVIFLSIWS